MTPTFSELQRLAWKLKEVNSKAAFFIAKELSIIEINTRWYPEKFQENISRLYSLSNHVTLTFKEHEDGKALSSALRSFVRSLVI